MCAVVIFVAAALLAAGSATGEPTSLRSQEQRAQDVLAQIQQIDAELGVAVEAYNLANVKLKRIDRELAANKRHLAIARTNFRRAQERLARRLVSIYTTGEESSALAVVLGASSLDDLLRRIDTVSRVSDQDTQVLRQMKLFRTQMQERAVALRDARAEQKEVVARKAAQRAAIERRLAERRQLLSSVRAEIARIQAAERARSLAIAQQVRVSPAPSSGGVGAAAVGSDGTSVAPPARHGGVVGIAMRYLGVPYKWGGASPSTGFDCSGFVMYVYSQVGVSLPHNAAAQYGYGAPVSRSQLAPGDLVFFNGLGHNGIYVGGGSFIHAPHTGDVVKISSMTGWYASTYVGARRL